LDAVIKSWSTNSYENTTNSMIKLENSYKKLPPLFHKEALPEKVPSTELIFFNHALAKDLNLDFSNYSDVELAEYFSGNRVFESSTPIALGYAGHQFGGFSPQLGDGRAILLGESEGKDIQLKGSGRTFYSRRGDGKSALGPVIREYIVSEAMHQLGVPTTRALAAVSTGELVQRETVLKGGVFTRVAKSHLRIGTFEYAASKNDLASLTKLADYAIERLYPELKNTEDQYLQFFRRVGERYLSLVSKWMGLGFIHGVMNTDNSSISGETLDFGPCAFMDEFNFNQVFSSIDEGGRYRYSNQPNIALWNLSSLGNCLVALVNSDQKTAIKILQAELEKLQTFYLQEWVKVMGKKLGILNPTLEDKTLIESWLNELQSNHLDFTHAHLSLIQKLSENKLPETEFDKNWKLRIKSQDLVLTEELMRKSNPVYIPRNHLVEKAIALAYEGDYSFAQELMDVLSNPYQKQTGREEFFEAPGNAQKEYKTFCGT